MIRVEENSLRDRFREHTYVTKNDLGWYLREQAPGLKEGTLRWHIHQLKESDILLPVKRGVYSLNKKTSFGPVLSRKLKKLYRQSTGKFSPELKCLIWPTEWLHQFMVLQPTHQMIILETEKDWMRSLFNILKDEGRNVFLNPTKDVIFEYILGQREPIIIKPYISRSPTQLLEGGEEVASLEKILVDIFCEKDLFVPYQGSELDNIFQNAWKQYSLNLSALLNYAKRRKRSDALLAFLERSSDKELFNLLK